MRTGIPWFIKYIFITGCCICFQVVELNEKDGSVKFTYLGSDLTQNQTPQYTVPPNVWFGSFPTNDFIVSGENGSGFVRAPPRDGETHYSLVGCTCAPAFQFQDFELAKRSHLIALFPQLEPLITALTFPEWVLMSSSDLTSHHPS